MLPVSNRLTALQRFSPAALANPASPDPFPRDTVSLTAPPPAEAPRPPSRRTILLAGLGVALAAAGMAAPLVAPQPPATFQCLEAGTVQVQTPSLLEQLLQPAETSQKGAAILACAGVKTPQELTSPADRAAFAWEGLVHKMGGERLAEHAGGGNATVWPYSQAMAASLDQGHIAGDYSTFDRLVQGLERYAHPNGGYGPSVGGRDDRFFDDNAWLGLDFVQAYGQRQNPADLQKAESIFAFLETGIGPEGGILWKENAERPTFNTCAQGPTIELAVRLYQATGNPHYLDVAVKMDSFTDQHLRLPDGLYADNIDTTLTQRDGTLYSYNQGTPVGAKRLLYQATGDVRYREQAAQTAKAAVEHYSQNDNLWKGSPAFNAVLLRNLMHEPQARELLSDYLDRAWSQALAPSGLFELKAGMGSYDGPELQMIDQAGLVQLYALQAWPAADLPLVS